MSKPVRTTLTVAGIAMVILAGLVASIDAIQSDDSAPDDGCVAGAARDGVREPRAESGLSRGRGGGEDSGGEVIFHDGFESGTFDDWYVQALDERATIVSPGAFGSEHAARFEVQGDDVEPDTGDERAEVSGPTVEAGQDLYVRNSIRVPRDSWISDSWVIVNQLHERDWDGPPGLAVFLDSAPCPSLEIGAGDGSPEFVNDVRIEPGRWHDLVYRVNLSQDPEEGFVEAWLDGRQLELVDGETRVYGQTLQTDSAYLKAGIYRSPSSSGTTVVEHDNLTIATSLEAALAGD